MRACLCRSSQREKDSCCHAVVSQRENSTAVLPSYAPQNPDSIFPASRRLPSDLKARVHGTNDGLDYLCGFLRFFLGLDRTRTRNRIIQYIAGVCDNVLICLHYMYCYSSPSARLLMDADSLMHAFYSTAVVGAGEGSCRFTGFIYLRSRAPLLFVGSSIHTKTGGISS